VLSAVNFHLLLLYVVEKRKIMSQKKGHVSCFFYATTLVTESDKRVWYA